MILLMILNTAWLGLIFMGLPGNWLMLISTSLFTWWRWDDHVFSIYTLTAAALLAIAAEMMEFFVGMAGAKKAGATRRGSTGALIGCIAGAMTGSIFIPIPLLGTLLGACLGAGIGAWTMELRGGKSAQQSVRIGMGAGLGTLAGTSVKLTLGTIIYLIFLIACFWP